MGLLYVTSLGFPPRDRKHQAHIRLRCRRAARDLRITKRNGGICHASILELQRGSMSQPTIGEKPAQPDFDKTRPADQPGFSAWLRPFIIVQGPAPCETATAQPPDSMYVADRPRISRRERANLRPNAPSSQP